MDAKYKLADIPKIVGARKDLSQSQRTALETTTRKLWLLFYGTLGIWKSKQVHSSLKKDAQPYHARPYQIPKSLERKVRLEIERLCKLGVLKKVKHSQWAAPNFVIPKKDETIRLISDFRELNKRIQRQPFPI